MQKAKGLTNMQLELLKMFKFQLNEDQLKEIKDLLAKYFAQKATDEMDKLWNDSNWDETTIEKWSNEHLRSKPKK